VRSFHKRLQLLLFKFSVNSIEQTSIEIAQFISSFVYFDSSFRIFALQRSVEEENFYLAGIITTNNREDHKTEEKANRFGTSGPNFGTLFSAVKAATTAVIIIT
jgi:hypothetical protein